MELKDADKLFTKVVQMNGVVTIPFDMRKKHDIEEGDFVTLYLVKVDKTKHNLYEIRH